MSPWPSPRGTETPGPAIPPADMLRALLAQSHELIALTDGAGAIEWCNPAFRAAAGEALCELGAWPPAGTEGAAPREALDRALRDGELADTELALPDPSGEPLTLIARASRVGASMLWTLRDVTAERRHAARERRLGELLDRARAFGRLGVWERDLRSGRGLWDAHVFELWGIDPAAGTPTPDEATRHLHPDDLDVEHRCAELSRRAGRYEQRYRIVLPGGAVRWIRSQWEVIDGADGEPERAIGVMTDETEAHELARSLDATSAQLRLAVDLGNIAIWRHDLATNRLHFNTGGYGVLGIPRRLDGLPLEEAHAQIHPDDLPRVLESARLALRSARPTDIEARYRDGRGGWRYILTRRVVEHDPTGRPAALVGVALDVTEQVARSRRAEELALRLEAAARAARIGIWTTTIATGATEWNARMFELFGLVEPGHAGPLPEPLTLGEWIRRCVHADDKARVGHFSRQYLKSGQGTAELEFRVTRRDGALRWIVLRASLDPSGTEERRVFGIAMDVTEHHIALKALRDAKERTELITRSAGIGTWDAEILHADHEGGGFGLGAVHWDDQMFRLRGLAPRTTPLTRAERLATVHPDDTGPLLDSTPRSEHGLETSSYEFRARLPDGSYRWLASRSAPVLDEQGTVVRRVGVNWDVTESKNAERAHRDKLLAERESRAKSQFLSRMSHELRTPLNAVLGFTQLLQMDADRDGAHGPAEKLARIRGAGEHLLALIDDVLDLSGLESGTQRLESRPVPLAGLVARALPMVESLAARHAVELRVGALEGTAWADPTRLLQVLVNLLSNAIKYNRRGGQALVEAGTDDDRVLLRVTDTGRGLGAEQLAHLFEPFNRLGLESESIEGTGIGLTIVKALALAMGGTVRATSEAGAGTVFEVALPRAHETAASLVGDAGTTPASEPPPASTPTPRPCPRDGQLLYIEDNPVNVLLVEELVTSLAGLRFEAAGTGEAGVARAIELLPGLILIDMQLPDFDGFEVLRRLRADAATAAIRCIALSANAMPDDIARALAAGFDDYWTKPIDFKRFLAALDVMFPWPAATAG